jgi:hypothetical protein
VLPRKKAEVVVRASFVESGALSVGSIALVWWVGGGVCGRGVVPWAPGEGACYPVVHGSSLGVRQRACF